MSDNNQYNSKALGWKPLLLMVGIIIALWLWTYLSFLWPIQHPLFNVGDRGTFGEMFGGLNTLFSGLAFAGLIYAILLQRKDLELQKTELKLTRETLEKQREEMASQNEMLAIQRFENTFFSMMRLLSDNTNAVTWRLNAGSIMGLDALKLFRENLINNIRNGLDDQKDLTVSYPPWFNDNASFIGPQISIIFNILSYIDGAQIEEKQTYADILRSNLTQDQQIILFYHGLSDAHQFPIKPLIEKYAVLKSMPDRLLANAEHKQRYQDAAFDEQVHIFQRR